MKTYTAEEVATLMTEIENIVNLKSRVGLLEESRDAHRDSINVCLSKGVKHDKAIEHLESLSLTTDHGKYQKLVDLAQRVIQRESNNQFIGGDTAGRAQVALKELEAN